MKTKMIKAVISLEKGSNGDYLIARVERGVGFEKLYFLNSSGEVYNPVKTGGLVCHLLSDAAVPFASLPPSEKEKIISYREKKSAERKAANGGDAV